MANFITRMFTPSDSDQSGMQTVAKNVQNKKKEQGMTTTVTQPRARTQTRYAGMLGQTPSTDKKVLLGQ